MLVNILIELHIVLLTENHKVIVLCSLRLLLVCKKCLMYFTLDFVVLRIPIIFSFCFLFFLFLLFIFHFLKFLNTVLDYGFFIVFSMDAEQCPELLIFLYKLF